MMSLQAGGLSDDSQSCIKDVFAEFGVPSETMSETDSLRSFITMQLCLTDEGAQTLDKSGGEDPLPLPSQLRCLSEQTELENLFIIYQAFVNLESSTEPPTPSPEMTKAVAEIMAAQETCGIPTIIQGEGSAPQPARATACAGTTDIRRTLGGPRCTPPPPTFFAWGVVYASPHSLEEH